MQTARINVRARDVTGQKSVRVKAVPTDATVQELVNELRTQMHLPSNDSTGQPLAYHAFDQRLGKHLNAQDLIGDTVSENDELVLHPDIIAGQDK